MRKTYISFGEDSEQIEVSPWRIAKYVKDFLCTTKHVKQMNILNLPTIRSGFLFNKFFSFGTKLYDNGFIPKGIKDVSWDRFYNRLTPSYPARISITKLYEEEEE